MGAGTSALYNHSRRFILKYNAEHRAHKLITKKDKLPTAPRHPVSKEVQRKIEERRQSCTDLQSIHEKSPQLDEYLKKVYLISTPAIKAQVSSNRPLPVKTRRELKTMFYEPEKPEPGFWTLTNVVDILFKHQTDPMTWNINKIAQEYSLDKNAAANLLAYYSLFKIEDFQFMNAEPVDDKKEDAKIEFEIYTPLEKKPVRQIEGKK